jgi:acylphosphatase
VSTELALLHAFVYGRVQGVFFRSFVVGCARELGLTGYVQNIVDGSVEVMAEGNRQDLEKLVSLLKEGPPSARVIKVDNSWSEYTGRYSGFNVA